MTGRNPSSSGTAVSGSGLGDQRSLSVRCALRPHSFFLGSAPHPEFPELEFPELGTGQIRPPRFRARRTGDRANLSRDELKTNWGQGKSEPVPHHITGVASWWPGTGPKPVVADLSPPHANESTRKRPKCWNQSIGLKLGSVRSWGKGKFEPGSFASASAGTRAGPVRIRVGDGPAAKRPLCSANVRGGDRADLTRRGGAASR